ncbi:hypothetical protein BH10ACT3_BH10ACT3_17900 [soil metagenome]
MSSTFSHVPHPRIHARKASGPPKTEDELARGGPVTRFNTAVALAITKVVGTMWCAYAFGALALISLPEALRDGTEATISWIAQTFLQLVLLSIIIVGQNLQSAAGDARAQATYEDADAVLHTALEIQEHMQVQDEQIQQILAYLEARSGQSVSPPATPPAAD